MTVKNRNKIGCIIGLAILLAAFAGNGFAQGGEGREFHQIYPISAGGTVSLTGLAGSIRITSWNENRVSVDAVKNSRRGGDLSEVRIEVVAQPDRIEIKTIRPGNRNAGVTVDYVLKVPANVNLAMIRSASGDISITGPVASLAANTASGEINVRNVTGDATLTTASGRVVASAVGGVLRIQTASGDIQVDDARSRLFAQAASGSIRVGNVADDANLSAASGSISVERARGRVSAKAVSGSVSIRDAGGDVQADSLSDSITVTDAKGLVTASTLSGSITLTGIGDGVRAKAVSGTIQISRTRGRIDARTTSDAIILNDVESSDISAKTTSGEVRFSGPVQPGGSYSFESFSGNVVLTLPAASSFNLSARTRSDRVQSEFDLKSSPDLPGGSRGTISAVVGDGGPVINLATFSGNIYLKKK